MGSREQYVVQSTCLPGRQYDDVGPNVSKYLDRQLEHKPPELFFLTWGTATVLDESCIMLTPGPGKTPIKHANLGINWLIQNSQPLRIFPSSFCFAIFAWTVAEAMTFFDLFQDVGEELFRSHLGAAETLEKKLHQLSSLETSSSQYYFFLKSQNRFFLNSQSISQVRCCTSESTNELDQLYIQCKDHLTIYCKPLLVKPGVLYVCREKFTNLMNYSDALGVWWCFQCWRSKGEILTLQSDSGAAWQKIASSGRSQLAGLCQMLRPACWLTEVLEVTLTVVIMPWPDSILPQNFCSLCYAFCFDAVPRPWTLNLDESLTKFQSIIYP